MELRFAVVEDRLPDAQRLEGLLRLAFGNGCILVCDHFESGDAFLQAFPSRVDLVENNGFEPLTPCVQSRCSSQLS